MLISLGPFLSKMLCTHLPDPAKSFWKKIFKKISQKVPKKKQKKTKFF
jgi:hypothetical protein